MQFGASEIQISSQKRLKVGFRVQNGPKIPVIVFPVRLAFQRGAKDCIKNRGRYMENFYLRGTGVSVFALQSPYTSEMPM